jgi:hypothetical protein
VLRKDIIRKLRQAKKGDQFIDDLLDCFRLHRTSNDDVYIAKDHDVVLRKLMPCPDNQFQGHSNPPPMPKNNGCWQSVSDNTLPEPPGAKKNIHKSFIDKLKSRYNGYDMDQIVEYFIKYIEAEAKKDQVESPNDLLTQNEFKVKISEPKCQHDWQVMSEEVNSFPKENESSTLYVRSTHLFCTKCLETKVEHEKYKYGPVPNWLARSFENNKNEVDKQEKTEPSEQDITEVDESYTDTDGPEPEK